MAACAGIPAPEEEAASQGVDTLAALAMPGRRGKGAGGRRPEQRGQPGPSRPQDTATVTCFRCGQQGHIERGCRNAPVAFSKGAPTPPGPSSASSPGPQASRDASPAWPPPSRHASSGARVHRQGVVFKGSGAPPLSPTGWPRLTRHWNALAHRMVAAAAGSSALAGCIQGVRVRLLVDTGASATIISEAIFKLLPHSVGPLGPVRGACVATNGSSLGILSQVIASVRVDGIELAGPILVSKTLAVPCLLGTDVLSRMPIRIIVDQGCVELPSGRRLQFLQSPTVLSPLVASVWALNMAAVTVPPASQILLPLRLRRPLEGGSTETGILLSPSSYFSRTMGLVGALTAVSGGQDLFLQVLNLGPTLIVIPAGAVLAHATPAPPPESAAPDGGVVAGVMRAGGLQVLNLGPTPIVILAGAVLAHATPAPPPESFAPDGGVVAGVMRAGDSDASWIATLCDENASLSTGERQQLRELIERFTDVFSQSKFDLGRTTLLEYHIDTGDSAPIRLNSHRFSPAEKEHVRSVVDEMLVVDIVSPSTSPWGAPIVLVKKRDGSLRFCVDFRKLNKISEADAYPLPRMDDSLDALSGARFFSTLDLLSGFWQLPLDEASRPKTAFRTHQGLFEFNRLPMGLHSASATFQRLMEMVLAGLQWESCLIYLDDVIVFGRTFDEHLQCLEAVFVKVRAAGLKFKPQKCHLLQPSVKYLGHIVSASGVTITTDPEKTACVRTWPTLTSVAEVRSFVGFASYYCRFVRDFATIAKPLHALSAKGQRFYWGAEEEAAFATLRTALADAPPLGYPDFSKPFLLDTDASDMGIGAVLAQVVDGVERSASSITEAFVQGYVLDKGAPEQLLTDQGRNFSSKLLKEVCNLLGTKKIRTSPYHPQSDGMVDRLNRTLTSMLCWDLFVPGVLAAYRLAPHASTGFSPFYLMYGREPEPPVHVQLDVGSSRKGSAVPVPLKVTLDRLREARQAAAGNSAGRQAANERLPKHQGPVEVVEVPRPQCVQIQFGRRRALPSSAGGDPLATGGYGGGPVACGQPTCTGGGRHTGMRAGSAYPFKGDAAPMMAWAAIRRTQPRRPLSTAGRKKPEGAICTHG
ncbi:uncharacterized protein LOC142906516 [Petromyzon marinus]|uniref:uncharacterized protein LOC142906516 n=1 Tax=Petromyzon marinus TaxID=7757 RepID=UPI003F6F0704